MTPCPPITKTVLDPFFQPLTGFVMTRYFLLDISRRRLSSLKVWDGSHEGDEPATLLSSWFSVSSASSCPHLLSFPPNKIHMFLSMLHWLSTLVLAELSPSPLHLSHLWIYLLISLSFCCFLPLFPPSPSTRPALQKAAGGNTTS